MAPSPPGAAGRGGQQARRSLVPVSLVVAGGVPLLICLRGRLDFLPDAPAMVRAKLEYPNNVRRGYTKVQQDNIRKMNTGGAMQHWPRDGRKIGKDGTNVGVVDPEALAAEPLRLRVDRLGRAVLPGEAVDPRAPWSLQDATGRSAAEAPMSFEEFEARYKAMDRATEKTFNDIGMKDLRGLLSREGGKDEYRTVRTFAWPTEDGAMAAVMLVGVAETSARSRELTARAVYETQPSGLLVQSCRERIGRHFVMPEEHLAAVANYARGYAVGNPHGLRGELYLVDVLNGDYEAMKLWRSDLAYGMAVDEFMRTPRRDNLPKQLCLGDVRKSRIELLRKQHGNESLNEVPTRSARGKQVVRGLISLATMGHRAILGVVDVDLLATVVTWMERAGARLLAVADTSDIESGRESLAADMQMALRAQRPTKRNAAAGAPSTLGFGRSRLGAFISEEGMKMLQRRRERLRKTTRIKDLVRHCEPPAKVWQVAELLMGDGPTPGPMALLADPPGLRFEFGHLEIPLHYLREAGMEAYAPELWQSLCDRGAALETREPAELVWWAAGSAEATTGPRSQEEGDEDDMVGAGFSRSGW